MNSPRTVATAADSPVRKLSLFTSVVLVVVSGVTEGLSVQAQNSEQGKEIARGLLRALIESHLERQDRHSLTPGRPFPAGSAPGSQPALATPEMLQVRRLLASVAQESGILSMQLNSDSQRNVNVRSLVPNALSFQATATASQQRADRENNHLVIQLSVQSLDQSWRPLAHQLSTTQGLSTKTRESAERINRLNAQLCQILGIREQFNSRELVRAADLLTADLGTLTEEVSYTGSTIGSRSRLLSRMRKLQEQGALFANLAASGAQFRNVVTDYQSFYEGWQALRPEVDQLSARSVTRTVSRIQETHRTIHQLLRLDFGLDQALVRKMVDSLERDITDLYRTITLDQMLALPDSRSLPGSADSLLGNAQNLTDVVTRREPIQAVGEAWMYLDEQWQLFDFYLQPIHAPETRRKAEGVSQSIDSLKAAIGVSVAFDRHAILQQTASLESMADHLQATVRRWLNRPGQQNPAVAAEVKGFTDRCRELQALANAARDRNAMRIKCDEVITEWQQLRPKLSQCQTEEQESVEQTIDSLIPALIRLRTMLED